MIVNGLSEFIDPLIIEIYLFSSNYKDRLLIAELKKRSQKIKIDLKSDNAFFVSVNDVSDILYTTFLRDIKDFESTPIDSLNASVTSIFFIDSLIKEFNFLKYIKVNISNSIVYTRKQEDAIVFDYRIIYAKLDLPTFCDDKYLERIQSIFKSTELYVTSPFVRRPYIEISSQNLLKSLNLYKSSVDVEEVNFIENFTQLIKNKIEFDDSTLLIIVES